MSEELTVVPFDKVKGIEIECSCGKVFVVPASPIAGQQLDVHCPGCDKPLQTAVLALKSFESFRAFIQEKQGHGVAFRIVTGGT